jgi:hypothetical protein
LPNVPENGNPDLKLTLEKERKLEQDKIKKGKDGIQKIKN